MPNSLIVSLFKKTAPSNPSVVISSGGQSVQIAQGGQAGQAGQSGQSVQSGQSGQSGQLGQSGQGGSNPQSMIFSQSSPSGQGWGQHP